MINMCLRELDTLESEANAIHQNCQWRSTLIGMNLQLRCRFLLYINRTHLQRDFKYRKPNKESPLFKMVENTPDHVFIPLKQNKKKLQHTEQCSYSSMHLIQEWVIISKTCTKSVSHERTCIYIDWSISVILSPLNSHLCSKFDRSYAVWILCKIRNCFTNKIFVSDFDSWLKGYQWRSNEWVPLVLQSLWQEQNTSTGAKGIQGLSGQFGIQYQRW